jgi:hypothetical protein
MAAYCFFDVREVTDPEKLEQYKQGVLATVHQYGGRYLLLGGNCEGITGVNPLSRPGTSQKMVQLRRVREPESLTAGGNERRCGHHRKCTQRIHH